MGLGEGDWGFEKAKGSEVEVIGVELDSDG